MARNRYFSLDEVKRLLNAAAPDFRPLLRAALETGCRYGELTRLQVKRDHCGRGLHATWSSNSGKYRLVEVSRSLRRQCPVDPARTTPAHAALEKERAGCRVDGEDSENAWVGARASASRGDTWASHAVMRGMPLMVVARNSATATQTW